MLRLIGPSAGGHLGSSQVTTRLWMLTLLSRYHRLLSHNTEHDNPISVARLPNCRTRACAGSRLRINLTHVEIRQIQLSSSNLPVFAYIPYLFIQPSTTSSPHGFPPAAFTAATSSLSGRMCGSGPTGVIASGLICVWLRV